MPCLLIHGEDDDVIPMEDMVKGYNQLKKLGCNVVGYKMADLGHSINQKGLELSKKFIRQQL